MMVWVIFAVLTGAAVFAVLWPLSRRPATSDGRELDVAFYRAQADEIARDEARGVIGHREAEIARNEAGRRLLAASHDKNRDIRGSSQRAVRVVALGALVFVPALTIALYLHVGAPNMPDDPLTARLNADPKTMDMATMIAKIERNVAKDPNDGRGWAILAMVYSRLGRFDDAAAAFKNEIRVLGPSSDRYAGLGEAQMEAADNVVTADARHSFDEAVKLDPRSPRANYYLGVAALEDGDKPKALGIFQKIVAESRPDAPWLPLVNDKIAVITGEPTTAASPTATAEGSGSPPGEGQVAKPPPALAAAVAALPNDQQQAMIHRMVDGLASRLKSNGNDIDGWLRLVRAYRVLDESDRAKVALADARRNFAADPAATKRLDTLAHELGLES